MGEAVGVDLLARLALQAVVADGLGRGERLVEVARLELALGEHGRRPDARVAVGLKLEPDRELVGAVGIVALRLRDLVVGPLEVLDVVAELVGDHVRPGEVARRVELAAHVLVEAEVEIDARVGGQ